MRILESSPFRLAVPHGWENTTRRVRLLNDECVFACAHVIYRPGLLGRLKDALRRRPVAAISVERFQFPGVESDGNATDQDILNWFADGLGAAQEMIVTSVAEVIGDLRRFSITFRQPTEWGEPAEWRAILVMQGDDCLITRSFSVAGKLEEHEDVFDAVESSIEVAAAANGPD